MELEEAPFGAAAGGATVRTLAIVTRPDGSTDVGRDGARPSVRRASGRSAPRLVRRRPRRVPFGVSRCGTGRAWSERSRKQSRGCARGAGRQRRWELRDCGVLLGGRSPRGELPNRCGDVRPRVQMRDDLFNDALPLVACLVEHRAVIRVGEMGCEQTDRRQGECAFPEAIQDQGHTYNVGARYSTPSAPQRWAIRGANTPRARAAANASPRRSSSSRRPAPQRDRRGCGPRHENCQAVRGIYFQWGQLTQVETDSSR